MSLEGYSTEKLIILARKAPKNLRKSALAALSVGFFFTNPHYQFFLAYEPSTGLKHLVISYESFVAFSTQLSPELQAIFKRAKSQCFVNHTYIMLEDADDHKQCLKRIKVANQQVKDALRLAELKEYREKTTALRNQGTHAFLSLDCEMWERNHKLIIEVGWSIYDPQTQMVFDRHHIINNAYHLRNGRFVPDNKDNYLFGESLVTSITRTGHDLEADIRRFSPVVIVGHDVGGDISALNRCGIKLTDKFGKLLPTIDTGKLYMDVSSSTHNTTSLGNMCTALGLRPQKLHNAGNDARYTLMAFLKMTDPQREL
ncbi:hypothetical protein EV182_000191 [Spiromyces aspiralis]|uniref:Uncharacterized protein n=1 Tax=Spiromyces aspiralis TaxID=68401 RepID=A0ACC1HJM9_9FUNG|nr:hypothetical protein EV182_000191 [Spiromyces aspiralis]